MTIEQIKELARQAGFEILDCGNGQFIVEDSDAAQGSALIRYTELLLAQATRGKVLR